MLVLLYLLPIIGTILSSDKEYATRAVVWYTSASCSKIERGILHGIQGIHAEYIAKHPPCACRSMQGNIYELATTTYKTHYVVIT